MEINPDYVAIKKADKNLILKMEENELEEEVLFETESDFHSIQIVKNSIGKFLKYQDTYQAGVINSQVYCGNLPYINYFLIPYLMNKNIKNILLIGFGSGILVNQYEKLFEKLQAIDIVDIEENIFDIAKKYFNFKESEKQNFFLQDALIYLKTIKKKYDLIVVDVANNIGIDERFCTNDYIALVKKHLTKNGIFVSNLPSSFDIFNKKNKFALSMIEKYKSFFEDVRIFNGKTSSKLFYKTFFNLEEIVYDVTNMVLISSDKNYDFKIDEKISEMIEIEPYLYDLTK